MAEDKVFPQVEKIRTPDDELMVLSELADTTYFVVLKRSVRRFIEMYKNSVFLLNKDDPKFLTKFNDATSEARGMNKLIKLIDSARAEMAKKEGDTL